MNISWIMNEYIMNSEWIYYMVNEYIITGGGCYINTVIK